MSDDMDISEVARLFADGTRATMCVALLDGCFHSAGELTRVGGVSSSTASEHLGRLLAGGIVEAAAQGRHRYFRLSSPAVATAIESLGLLGSARPVRSLREARAGEALRAGRMCYDHLAGRLGVAITGGLVEAGVLTPVLEVADPAPLSELGVQLHQPGSRPAVRPCVDWTERRYHVAGALAAALAIRLIDLRWLERLEGRAVRLTARGREGLETSGLLTSSGEAAARLQAATR